MTHAPAPHRSSLWQRLREHVLHDVLAPSHASGREMLQLLLPSGRSANIRPYIAGAITARVQLLSLVFALLVPLWAVLDLLLFEPALGLRLAGLRLASAAVFCMLVWPFPPALRHPYRQALTLLVAMLMVPPLFYLASLNFVHYASPGLSEGQRLLLHIYALLPTLSLAGLAIFPLSALETMLIATPIIAIAVFGASLSGESHRLVGYGPSLWFMAMMVGVAAFSGMGQLHYMETLMRAATLDALTGARTRRAGTEELQRLWQLAEAEDRNLGVAFFDLDHFKRINDVHGHAAGDRVLQTFAAVARACLRDGDVLARYGGEEFVLLLPNTDADQFTSCCERLREAFANAEPVGVQVHNLSLSAGMTLLSAGDDLDEALQRADQALYRAKRGGRNRCDAAWEGAGA